MTTDEWPQSVAAARAQQIKWAGKLKLQSFPVSLLRATTRVVGVDVGVDSATQQLRAAAVLVDPINAELRDMAVATATAQFPYVPGYLSYREVPVILAALAKLAVTPDILFCDGQGIAHPRQFGIACHLGLLQNCPSIGIAKSLLFGTAKSPAAKFGAHSVIEVQGNAVGMALRSREQVKPIYLSPGHKINLLDALQWTLHFCRGFKLPEPTRLADQIASRRHKKWQTVD
ncbi:MAG: endonuclease V [Gammaproteobacteria bacterium]|nr:endonuclease V [Gammaproteobacteria bacterium]